MPVGVPGTYRTLLRVAAGGMVGALLVGLLSLTLVPRVYTSAATVVFPLPTGAASSLGRSLGLGGAAGMEVPSGSSFPLNTYRALLLSDEALMATAAKLQIQERFQLDTPQATLGWFRNSVRVEIDEDRTLRVISSITGTPSVVRPSDLYNRLAANQRDQEYRNLASEVITALLHEMGKLADEFKIDQSKAELEAVEEMLALRTAQEQELRQELDDQVRAEPTGDAGVYSKALSERYVAARSELTKIESELAAAQRRRKVLADQVDRQVRTMEELPEEVAFLQDRREALSRASESYAVATSQWGPESPEVRRAKLDLDHARKDLAAAAANAQAGLTPDLLNVDAQIEVLQVERQRRQAELSGMVGELNNAVVRAGDIATLSQQLEAARLAIAGLEERLAKARIEFSYRGIHWRTVSRPMVPLSKSAPSTMLALLTGFLAGAILLGWRPLLDWLMATARSVTDSGDED